MSEGQDNPGDAAHLRALNTALREENERLRAIVETLKRALYGGRSEKQGEPAAQLPLALGDLSPAAAEPAKLPSPANTNRPPRPKPARNIGDLPAHLPRVDIIYTLGHWNGLGLFLTDGRIEVDNNTVERTIRPISLGRKNALFAGSAGGGESWAILASLINTAKLHELDPQTYLADVLECIITGQTKINALNELLPWRWKELRAQQAQAA